MKKILVAVLLGGLLLTGCGSDVSEERGRIAWSEENAQAEEEGWDAVIEEEDGADGQELEVQEETEGDGQEAEVQEEDITDYGEDDWRAEQAEALEEYHKH